MNAIHERCAAVDDAFEQLRLAVASCAAAYGDTVTSERMAAALAAGFAGVLAASDVSLAQILAALAKAGVPLELATVNALPC